MEKYTELIKEGPTKRRGLYIPKTKKGTRIEEGY
jgi:hypothetical protein